MSETKVCRGDIFYVNLGDKYGSVQSGWRPAVIIQNNVGNKYSPTVQIAPLTNEANGKKNLPTHILVKSGDIKNLKYDSIILMEQTCTIDKKQLGQKIATLTSNYMTKINLSILVSFGMGNLINNITMPLIAQCI